MSTQMGDFLIKLSQDPILSERYKDDPSGVMSGFNLTQEEAALLMRGDSAAIDGFLRIEAAASNGKKTTTKKKKGKKK